MPSNDRHDKRVIQLAISIADLSGEIKDLAAELAHIERLRDEAIQARDREIADVLTRIKANGARTRG